MWYLITIERIIVYIYSSVAKVCTVFKTDYVNSSYNKWGSTLLCPGAAGTLGIFLNEGLVVSGVNFGKWKITKESIKIFKLKVSPRFLSVRTK